MPQRHSPDDKKNTNSQKIERWERKEKMERRETEKLTITGEKEESLTGKSRRLGEREKREREIETEKLTIAVSAPCQGKEQFIFLLPELI